MLPTSTSHLSEIRLRRGAVLHFDAATWAATVALDGAIGAVALPVGEWVPAGMISNGESVAVLLFDDANPDDGLVLGAFGGVSTFNYPELSGLSAGQVLRATSAAAVAFGAVDLADADARTGTLPVGNGGTGTSTQFTDGSIVFAGASGVYAQDNDDLFWDRVNIALGIGTATIPSFTALAVDQTKGSSANPVSSMSVGSTVSPITLLNIPSINVSGFGVNIFRDGDNDDWRHRDTSRDGVLWAGFTNATDTGRFGLYWGAKGSGSVAMIDLLSGGSDGIRVNDTGTSTVDFLVKSDNYNAFFVDASNDSAVLMNNSAGKIGFFGATPVVRASAYTVTNPSADRAFDASSAALAEVRNVLGTLIADLKSYGLLQ